jgi:hypothetical protein
MRGPSKEIVLLNPDFRDMLSAFSDRRVEYLLVGGYALAAHGLPRATGDLDLWIRPTPDNARRAMSALKDFGAPLMDLREEDLCTPGTVFQIGVAPCRVDLLTAIDGVTFDEAWPNREAIEIENLRVLLLGRNDLIRNKKASGRSQDLADIARLEELQP